MNIKQTFKHWMKIDHITFLLIAPALILGYPTVALILWTTAFGVFGQASAQPRTAEKIAMSLLLA